MSKPQRIEPSIREAAPADEAVRKPRVLPVVAAGPVPHAEPPTRAIPAPQLARICAWLKYGMTAGEVAEVYGVAGSEIEHILRTA
jgi:hypothetical protein